jgi:hypothetical protein
MGLWLAVVLWYRGLANKFSKWVGFYTAELLCKEADITFPSMYKGITFH